MVVPMILVWFTVPPSIVPHSPPPPPINCMYQTNATTGCIDYQDTATLSPPRDFAQFGISVTFTGDSGLVLVGTFSSDIVSVLSINETVGAKANLVLVSTIDVPSEFSGASSRFGTKWAIHARDCFARPWCQSPSFPSPIL